MASTISTREFPPTHGQNHELTVDHDMHPPDGGRHAWLFLMAVSVSLQLTWGFTISFGAFREYYFNNTAFAGNQTIAVIGVVSTGVIQIMCPFLVHLLTGRAHLRRPLIFAGALVTSAASISAGFASNPIQLIMTQGVLYGFGSGLIFAPNMSLIDEWFVKRRSLAYGIYFASSSISAAIIPPVLRVLLERYSAKATLMGWGLFVGVSLGMASLGIRPRIHAGPSNLDEKSSTSYAFLKKPLFWLIILSNIMQAASQYLPSVYIPSYATEVAGTSPAAAAVLLTIYNVASAVLQPFIGIFADKRGVLWPLLTCTLVPSVAVLGVWGFAKSYGVLVVVCVLFGGLSGGYVVLRNRFATAIVGDGDHPDQELVVSGLIMFIRGCATIGSGFIGAAVSQAGEEREFSKGAYGAGTWLPLLLTVGILAGVASIGAIGFVGRGKSRGVHR